MIKFGFGGGGGKKEKTKEGAGLGGGATISPWGYILVTADNIEFKPTFDLNKLACLAAFILALKIIHRRKFIGCS